MSDAKPVAWEVREDIEGHSTVVFHHHGLAAQRVGADQLDTEFECVSCSRAPEFDQFADIGYAPPIECIKRGWWFLCVHCNVQVNEDDFDVSKLIEHGKDCIFCSSDCHKAHHEEIEKINIQHRMFNQWFLNSPLYPYIDVVKWSPGYPMLTMSIAFTFAGSQHQSTIRKEHDETSTVSVGIPNGDLQAWRKFIKPLQNIDGSLVLDWKASGTLPELTPKAGGYGY